MRKTSLLCLILLLGLPSFGVFAQEGEGEVGTIVDESVDAVVVADDASIDDTSFEEFVEEDEFVEDEFVEGEIGEDQPVAASAEPAVVESEPIAAPAQPVITPSSAEATVGGPKPQPALPDKMAWQFIEDELLLGPGYASAFLTPVKGLGAVGTLCALGSHVTREKNETNGPSLAARWWVNMIRGKVWSETGQFSSFTYKLILAVGAIAGYKLTGWAIDSLLYGFALNGFLLKYPQVNRSKTPKTLQPFFDKEFEEFVSDKGGLSYILRRRKKVIRFVRQAVNLHKKGIKLSL